MQGIVVDDQDLPVNEQYVQGVIDAGAEAFFRTRWMNGVLVQGNAATAASVAGLAFVDRVEFVAPGAKLLPNGRIKNSHKTKDSKSAAKTQAQLHLIGLDDMQASGYRGEGIHIGIFDSGFQGVNSSVPFQHIFSENRLDLAVSKDFVYNAPDVFQYDEHGTQVFSVIAAFQDGNFTGGSYAAYYQLYVTEDVSTEYRIEEYNWLFAAERADSAGVDVINSSLGYYDFDDAAMNYPKTAMDGKTTVVTLAAQWAADRGIVVVCSAGNEGNIAWQIITAPADAADVLAIANVNSAGLRAGSSSIGPSADGRIKPDVAAMGVSTSVIFPNGSVGTVSGTSVSAPLVTSLVAGVWQRYPQLSNKELIAAIRNSASQANHPDFLLGYGIPNFKAVVNYLEQGSQAEIFVVYPNPITSDTLTIRPFDPDQVTHCRVSLISSQGQLIHDQETNFSWLNRTLTLDLNALGSGLYYIRIIWAGKRYTYKMVKV
jgi:subtilisin family serine protease